MEQFTNPNEWILKIIEEERKQKEVIEPIKEEKRIAAREKRRLDAIRKTKEKRHRRAVYYKECWEITESNKLLIKGIEKRKFKEYDIDHIVPISFGFKNSIPPKFIGSVDNLRIIPNGENLAKSYFITDEGKLLLQKWGYIIE